MNKRIIIFLITVLSLHIGTQVKGQQLKKAEISKNQNEIYSDWSLYSKGLYYKSIKDYQKAINLFMDAATFKKDLPRVYYQLSECYFQLQNYETAINYSELAIKKDKNFVNPFMLLYKIYLNLCDYEKSASVLESIIDIKPELINIHYTLGILYYNQLKNFDKALVSFRNILELSNAVAIDDYYKEQANYYMGRIYYNKNQVERSLEYFKKVVEINPDNNIAFYLLVRILLDKYNYDEAKKYASYYITKFPENLMMYASLGRIYYIENNPKSREYLRKAASINSLQGQLAKALYDEQFKRDKKAAIKLETIIKKDPLLISPHIALGRINLRKNKKKEALNEFFTAGILMYKAKLYNGARRNLYKVLSINDKIPEVYYYLAKIYEDTGNLSLAIINLKKTNELNPNMEILIHLGYMYSQKNNFNESTKHFDLAINSDPNNPKPYFFMGLTYSRNKNYLQAEKLIKKAIKLNEDNDTYHFYLATVLEKQNKLQETIQSLKKAIEFNPENAMAYNYLGYLYADLNINIDESIDLIHKALEFSPSNGAYLDSLGWAYYRKGKLKTALKKLLRAEKQLRKSNTPDPVVYDHIGDTYHKIGNKERAVEYWKKSLNLKKNQKIEKKIKNTCNIGS